MNEKDQYVSKCQEIRKLWNEFKAGKKKDRAAVGECAKKIADMCRDLHSFCAENEAALCSVMGIQEWGRILQEEARRIEEKLEEEDFDGCQAMLEEDIEVLLTGAITCIERQRQ